jgi:hypothetical protein
MYFLETMDPTGDTDTDFFNTTKTVDPQFLVYNIKHFFGGVSTISRPQDIQRRPLHLLQDALNILQHNSHNSNRPKIRPRNRGRHPATASGQAEQSQ